MKTLNLSVSTQTELSTQIQTICNEILNFKKNETVTVDNTLTILKDGFDLDNSDIQKISSILTAKQTDKYEKLVSDRTPQLSSLCNILNINMFDKNGNKLDTETLKKRVTNKKHRVSLTTDTPIENDTDLTQPKELP